LATRRVNDAFRRLPTITATFEVPFIGSILQCPRAL
jgi:hypothetical protein